jgi:glycosyltransferase involved in cell wall biosynthesis
MHVARAGAAHGRDAGEFVKIGVIPALDEEGSVGEVVHQLRAHVDQIVVADNGSRDRTAEVARAAGAEVVREPRRGYGAACLVGVRRARELGARVVLFLDADGSDDPSEAPLLLGPIVRGEKDLVLGYRVPHRTEPGAMTPVQRFGNWFAPLLMRTVIGTRYRDVPPFKAITIDALDRLALTDTGMGYSIQMLLGAHRHRLRIAEVEVSCRARRAGASKVSGTVRGTVRAALKITSAIAWHAIVSRDLSARRP